MKFILPIALSSVALAFASEVPQIAEAQGNTSIQVHAVITPVVAPTQRCHHCLCIGPCTHVPECKKPEPEEPVKNNFTVSLIEGEGTVPQKTTIEVFGNATLICAIQGNVTCKVLNETQASTCLSEGEAKRTTTATDQDPTKPGKEKADDEVEVEEQKEEEDEQ